MNRLTLAATAILLASIPLANLEAAAAPKTQTVSLALTYDRTAAPEKIYAGLRRQAREFCAPGAMTHQQLGWNQRRCVTGIVSRAVAKIGQPALAEVHARAFGRIA